MSVSVNQLTKIYGQQKALDAISFEVKPGEILGFLGPNGAGKSTTMKILTGYLPQNSGKASVCGFDVNEQSIEVRKNIGYLPELNPLYTDMFVKEYLLFAAETQGLGKSANKAVEEMIDKTGLTRERKKYIGQLSKGYKQRVGLAAAMLHNPKVLILDEPTSGLDPNQVGDMRNLIKEIGRDKTVILSTHIMQEVEAMCSRVVIINKGKIVADDNIVNLQKSMEKEFIIALELKSEIDKNLLMNIEGVTNVKAENNKYIIFASRDVREYVAALSSQNNWLILSMSLEEKSLEEVFQNLTN
ncbi:MAG: gliding motility-associated ABC transporter ATP-binding subunit GldA [Bacteroidetes bacterium]|nr:gliding motility-associated ABC transporter ATP-binding subunit GldA [Bacteroidota bacterium]